MDVTLKINGRDFAPRLSTYSVKKEITYDRVITTMDMREHTGRRWARDVLTFSLFPFDDSSANGDHDALNLAQIEVTFTDPGKNADVTKVFRLVSDLNAVFGLKSINGNRYYKGGNIVLRALEAE